MSYVMLCPLFYVHSRCWHVLYFPWSTKPRKLQQNQQQLKHCTHGFSAEQSEKSHRFRSWRPWAEGCTGHSTVGFSQMYLEPRAFKFDMLRQHMEKLQRCIQHRKTMSPALAGVEIRLVLSIDAATVILKEQSEFPCILVIIWASNKFNNTSPRIDT